MCCTVLVYEREMDTFTGEGGGREGGREGKGEESK